MYILVLNSGSSSLKLKIFKPNSTQPQELLSILVEAINLPNSSITIKQNQTTTEFPQPIQTHEQALKLALTQISQPPFSIDLNQISLIGHRVVHGGEKFNHPTEITPEIFDQIQALSHLAPLHNPSNLKGIKACQHLIPTAKNIAVFDTAFHQTMPEKAFLYAIPYQIYQQYQIRRYGFHGINHKHVSEQATQILKQNNFPNTNLITCHLGNGCSITAIKNRQSIDTSMGFTPLEGLIMGTRSGDIDPAVTLELCNILNKTPQEVETMLNSYSGLKGISGESSDMRILIKNANNNDPRATLAIEMFCYRLAKYIGSFIAILNEINAIIFTGGIGEHSSFIRQKVLNYFKFLNLNIDQTADQNNQIFITDPTSPTQVLVIPANEELEIATQIISTISNQN